MKNRSKILIVALLIALATISIGCIELDGKDTARSDNKGLEMKTTEYDIDTIWIGYHPDYGLKAVVMFDDGSRIDKLTFLHFHVLEGYTDTLEIISSNRKKLVCTGDNKCVAYFPKKNLIGLGLSELNTNSDETVNISKLDENVLTLEYTGHPDSNKVIIFSKENNGDDALDETRYLGDAFQANDNEWKFVFESDRPIPKLVMAMVVINDPLEREEYSISHQREYIALDIRPTESLQKH